MTDRIKVTGANGISAEVVQHSIDENGKEIITFNLEYWLCVHAEFLRHRLLSNSVKSNRAIPMAVLRKEVRKNPYVPVWFGAKQKGMVADSEVRFKSIARRLWLMARWPAIVAHWVAERLLGAHKEWASRLLNPWQYVRETVTATEWDNFYMLRTHSAAQKDIQELARTMKAATELSTPMLLKSGEWHVPYVERTKYPGGIVMYYDNDSKQLTAKEAIKCSAARCARSSYDKHDGGRSVLEEDEKLYDMLITSKPTHGSPAEHQGTPMIPTSIWESGETHHDREGRRWSGNFIGWIQHRQQLEDHAYWGDNNNGD